LRLVRLYVSDHDVRTLGSVSARNRLADAARAARDDGNLVYKFHDCAHSRSEKSSHLGHAKRNATFLGRMGGARYLM
jgi:hypothetical protein